MRVYLALAALIYIIGSVGISYDHKWILLVNTEFYDYFWTRSS